MARWSNTALFAPGGSSTATGLNGFLFALTPDGALAYWWPDVIETALSIVPASQVMMYEASGKAEAQGIISGATDPAEFTILMRTSGADLTQISWTLSYKVLRAGDNGEPIAFTRAVVSNVIPAGATLKEISFAIPAGDILAGDMLLIKLERGADANPDKAIIVAGYLL